MGRAFLLYVDLGEENGLQRLSLRPLSSVEETESRSF